MLVKFLVLRVYHENRHHAFGAEISRNAGLFQDGRIARLSTASGRPKPRPIPSYRSPLRPNIPGAPTSALPSPSPFRAVPATLAYLAWDLQRYSHGRFILGLGPQVKAHNVLRFGVKWEKPVKKMRETIEAIHAFWHSWQTGEPFRYIGEFFKLVLMTPFFDPGPLEVPPPPIYIAAMNRLMLRLAGSHCEGVHIHALHSVKYLQEIAMPELAVGWARSGKEREAFTVTTAVFVIPSDDPHYAAYAEQHVRQQISFYLSTPAYRLIAELHGWEEEAQRLSMAARDREWDQMAGLVTDEMLDTLVVSGTWAELPFKIKAKYGDLLDRISYYLPFIPGENEAGWQATIAGFSRL